MNSLTDLTENQVLNVMNVCIKFHAKRYKILWKVH